MPTPDRQNLPDGELKTYVAVTLLLSVEELSLLIDDMKNLLFQSENGFAARMVKQSQDKPEEWLVEKFKKFNVYRANRRALITKLEEEARRAQEDYPTLQS